MKALAWHLAKRLFRALPLTDRQRTALAFSIFTLTGERLKHLPSYRLYLRDRKWHKAKVPADLPAYRAKMLAQHFSNEDAVPKSSDLGVPSKREAANAVGESEARGSIPPKSKAMLMVSHTLGGGTEQHVEDLAERLEAEGWRIFHLQRHNENHLRLVTSRFERGEPLYYRWPDERAALAADWAALGIAHLHLHHTVDLPRDFLLHFAEVAVEAGLPYDYTVHDYFSICPRFTLFDEAVRGYCGEPSDVRKCSACVKHLGSAAGKDVDVAAWRRDYGALLQGARKVFVPDSDVAMRLTRYFPAQEFTLRPHPEKRESGVWSLESDKNASPRNIAIIGGIAPHKGSKVLLDCAEDALKRHLPLTFTLIGYSDIDHKLKALPNVTVTGAFEPKDLTPKLRAGGYHLAFLPSVIPETYNYVLSECWRHGLFTACFDIGAIASRIKAAPGLGAVLPYEWYFQPQKVNDALLALEIPALPSELPLTDYPSAERDYYGL